MKYTRPNMKKWNDKRYWRGFQRQQAREYILEVIEDLIKNFEYNITPTYIIQIAELKSIAAVIKRRRLAKRNK